ncbi:hypothetical protein MASR2M29_08330 [Spirochaetota bacterium]
MITIKYGTTLAAMAGKKTEELEASNVRDALRHIKNAYGNEAFKEAKRMLITVNKESILLKKSFVTALHDGDELAFFPILAGG